MKKIILILLTGLFFSINASLADERPEIDSYDKVLAKFEKLSNEKKLPILVALKMHSEIQIRKLAERNKGPISVKEQFLYTFLGLELNKNMIDFAKSADAAEFMQLFKDENAMLEERLFEKISHDEFKKKQKAFFANKEALLKKISKNKTFKKTLNASEDEVAYFHKHHFLNALYRATERFKQGK